MANIVKVGTFKTLRLRHRNRWNSPAFFGRTGIGKATFFVESWAQCAPSGREVVLFWLQSVNTHKTQTRPGRLSRTRCPKSASRNLNYLVHYSPVLIDSLLVTALKRCHGTDGDFSLENWKAALYSRRPGPFTVIVSVCLFGGPSPFFFFLSFALVRTVQT